RRTALTDHENVMRVRKRFDLGHLRAGLWTDDDLDAALIEILNSVERLFRIEVCIPNKELKPGWVRLRASVFEVCCCNPQCGDGIFAESRPRSTQVGEHANLYRSLGTISRSNFCGGTDYRQKQSRNDDTKTAGFHKRPMISTATRESQERSMLFSGGRRPAGQNVDRNRFGGKKLFALRAPFWLIFFCNWTPAGFFSTKTKKLKVSKVSAD